MLLDTVQRMNSRFNGMCQLCYVYQSDNVQRELQQNRQEDVGIEDITEGTLAGQLLDRLRQME